MIRKIFVFFLIIIAFGTGYLTRVVETTAKPKPPIVDVQTVRECTITTRPGLRQNLNLREGPDESYRIRGVLALSDTVKYLEGEDAVDETDNSLFWYKVETDDGQQAYVAGWLTTKPVCTETQVPVENTTSQCANPLQFVEQDNLLIEQHGLLNYADGLTVNQIVQIADLVDSTVIETYRDQKIYVYFINNVSEGKRLFGDNWTEDTGGIYSKLRYDGCQFLPVFDQEGKLYIEGILQLVEVVVVMGDNDTLWFTAGSLAHEFCHAMACGHGFYAHEDVEDKNPDINKDQGNFYDAYFWSEVLVLLSLRDCGSIPDYAELSNDAEEEVCSEMNHILLG